MKIFIFRASTRFLVSPIPEKVILFRSPLKPPPSCLYTVFGVYLGFDRLFLTVLKSKVRFFAILRNPGLASQFTGLS